METDLAFFQSHWHNINLLALCPQSFFKLTKVLVIEVLQILHALPSMTTCHDDNWTARDINVIERNPGGC